MDGRQAQKAARTGGKASRLGMQAETRVTKDGRSHTVQVGAD